MMMMTTMTAIFMFWITVIQWWGRSSCPTSRATDSTIASRTEVKHKSWRIEAWGLSSTTQIWMIAYLAIIGTPSNEPLPKDLLVDWIMASSQTRWAPILQIDPVNPFDATKAGLYIPCLQGPSAVLWNIRTTSPPEATSGWRPWPKHASPKWNSRESCENPLRPAQRKERVAWSSMLFSKSSFFLVGNCRAK